jgi:hypothetical protein
MQTMLNARLPCIACHAAIACHADATWGCSTRACHASPAMLPSPAMLTRHGLVSWLVSWLDASNFPSNTLSSPPTYAAMPTHGSRAMRTHASLCARMHGSRAMRNSDACLSMRTHASGSMLPAGVLTCAMSLDSRGLQAAIEVCAVRTSYALHMRTSSPILCAPLMRTSYALHMRYICATLHLSYALHMRTSYARHMRTSSPIRNPPLSCTYTPLL